MMLEVNQAVFTINEGELIEILHKDVKEKLNIPS